MFNKTAIKNYKLSYHQNLHKFSNINLCLMSYFKSFSIKDSPPGTTSNSIKEWNEPLTLLAWSMQRGCLIFLPFQIFHQPSLATFLASITLYICNNIIIIFQIKTKVKTRENRSVVRWELINRPWLVAWADGDGNKGEVQNKFCYIFQNKNQKIYWGSPGPHWPP